MSTSNARLLDAVAAQLARAVGDDRGRLLQLARRCGGCRVLANPIWRFARVDAGELWLCTRCRGELEARRAGRSGRRERARAIYVDAMERAVSAGTFEGNRRRH